MKEKQQEDQGGWSTGSEEWKANKGGEMGRSQVMWGLGGHKRGLGTPRGMAAWVSPCSMAN